MAKGLLTKHAWWSPWIVQTLCIVVELFVGDKMFGSD